MDVLLTNDDGILAEGLWAMYTALKKTARVHVVAPSDQMSSISHAISLSRPITVEKIKRDNKPLGYGLTGTPADCVKYALRVLKIKPQLVISGINQGQNDGCSVFYSGTIAGAREASLSGLPAFAISLASFTQRDFSHAAQFGCRLAKKILENPLPAGTFLNVNIPALPRDKIRGIKITKQCAHPIKGIFYKRKTPHGQTYFWMSGKTPISKNDNTQDTYALQQNYITITPIQNDLTDYTVLDSLKEWPF